MKAGPSGFYNVPKHTTPKISHASSMSSSRQLAIEPAAESYAATRRPMKVFRWAEVALILILVTEACIDFALFAFVGLTLKWCLTMDHSCAPHTHPHTDDEAFIQRPNNLLSIVMTAVIIDFAQPIVLLVWYCRTRGNIRRRFPRVRGCLRLFFFFYSWLCLILIGAALASCLAIAQNNYPPDLRADGRVLENGCVLECQLASCPGGGAFPPYPPPAPAPPRPLLEPGQLYLMYSLLGLVSLLKLASYALGYPFLIYQWDFIDVY